MNRSVRLGCKPAIYDPRMPKISSLKMADRMAPASVTRSLPLHSQMFGNNTLGNCTAAGMFNGLEATASLGGFSVPATTNDAIDFYCRSTGYVRGNPATDKGGYEVDVLKFAAEHGVEAGGNFYFPIPFTADPYDFNAMRLSIAFTGFAYLGVELAISDMNQAEASGMNCILDVDNGSYGNPTPGSEGGHCLLAVAYTGSEDTDVTTLVTWGTNTIRCTNRWLRSRIMEQHAMIWPQLSGPHGVYPTGESFENLRADVKTWLTP